MKTDYLFRPTWATFSNRSILGQCVGVPDDNTYIVWVPEAPGLICPATFELRSQNVRIIPLDSPLAPFTMKMLNQSQCPYPYDLDEAGQFLSMSIPF